MIEIEIVLCKTAAMFWQSEKNSKKAAKQSDTKTQSQSTQVESHIQTVE